MKDIFLKLFGKAGGGIVDSISGVVDKFVKTPDEKAAFEKIQRSHIPAMKRQFKAGYDLIK